MKNQTFMTLIANILPWLTLAAPAYFVYDSLLNVYQTPWLIALSAAIGLEATGISTSTAALRAYTYNQAKLKKDPAAPTWLALSLAGGYLIIGITLTAVLKRDWTLALFFLLAAAGYATLALNHDQIRREAQAVRAADTRKQERRDRPPKKPPSSAEGPVAPQPIAERSPNLDLALRTIAERSAGKSFKRLDVQGWTERSKTSASALIKYGLKTNQIQAAGRHQYIIPEIHE